MANLVRIYKSKRAINEVQITKPMSRSPPRKLDKSNFMPTCHHYGVSNIKRNYFKLRYQLATSLDLHQEAKVILRLLNFPPLLWPV